ncbi:phosphotransferase [Kocuria rhizophila]|nr:phosphotransferase [Kocuria rhizophila]
MTPQLVHGDLMGSNMLWQGERLVGVMGWNACLSDPAYDIASLDCGSAGPACATPRTRSATTGAPARPIFPAAGRGLRVAPRARRRPGPRQTVGEGGRLVQVARRGGRLSHPHRRWAIHSQRVRQLRHRLRDRRPQHLASACALGVVRVRDGRVVDTRVLPHPASRRAAAAQAGDVRMPRDSAADMWRTPHVRPALGTGCATTSPRSRTPSWWPTTRCSTPVSSRPPTARAGVHPGLGLRLHPEAGAGGVHAALVLPQRLARGRGEMVVATAP